MNSQQSSSNLRSISSQPVLSSTSLQHSQSSGPVPPPHAMNQPTPTPAVLVAADPEAEQTVDEEQEAWKTASPGYVPAPTYSPQFKYVELARQLTDHIITHWIPHRLSFQERHFYVNQTRHLVHRINVLERLRASKNPNIVHEYTVSRMQYSIRFGRAFRINDLPNEILTSILRLCCWSADTPTQHTLWRLWLTSTCSHFRSVMLGDPTLWTAIVFHDASQLRQAVAYLDRTGPLPFDVRIGESTKGPMKMQDLGPLFQEIWKKMSQLRTLIVVVQDWDPIVFIFGELARVHAQKVPLVLAHLEIHRTGPYYIQSGAAFPEEVYEYPPPLFGGALVPTLRIISLDAVHTNWKHTRLFNLTTLDIRKLPFSRSPSNSEFKNLLRTNPGLKKLLMDGAGPLWPLNSTEANIDLEPVVLPELEQLVLGDFSLLYGVHLLSLFRTPKMTDITLLNACGDDQPAFFDALLPLCPNVRVLSLFKCETVLSLGMSHSIAKWLYSMKHLGYLRICNVNEHFLSLFMYDPETLLPYTTSEALHGIICPKLSIFEMQRAPAGMIAHFAKSRRELGAPLSKILVPLWMRHAVSRPQALELMAALGSEGKLDVLFGKAEEEDAYRNALSGSPPASSVEGEGQT